MADTYRVVGTTSGAGDIEFGTTGAGYFSVGEIQSASLKQGGEKLELKSRNGNTFCVIYFNSKGECSITAIWDNDYADPARGDAISLCGLANVLVEDVTHNWSAGKERSITINAIKYDAALVVA